MAGGDKSKQQTGEANHTEPEEATQLAIPNPHADPSDELTREHDIAWADTSEHDTGVTALPEELGSSEDWANWDRDDAEGGWFKCLVIEAAQQSGDPALVRRRLNEFGVHDEQQWHKVRATFLAKHGSDSQARADAHQRQRQSPPK